MTELEEVPLQKEICGQLYSQHTTIFELVGYSRPTVVKYMNCGKESDEDFHHRVTEFRNERDLLRLLSDHPNIVLFYESIERPDFIDQTKRFGFIMEYCVNGSLRSVINKTSLKWTMKTVVLWAEQIFSALVHIHTKHWAHLDVKAENLFLNDGFILKLGDFGTAQRVEGTVEETYQGTPRYTSPSNEQVISCLNDVYSAALTIWEIIERRLVFDEYGGIGKMRLKDLQRDVASGSLKHLSRPSCDAALADFLISCASFQSSSRPSSAEALEFFQEINQANRFLNTFEFKPTQDRSENRLLRPLGFDGRREWVFIGDESEKGQTRFD